MITAIGSSAATVAAPTRRWQAAWRDSITDPHELLNVLGLADESTTLLPAIETGFAMRVPRGFVARMRHCDASDPLLLQVLPQAAELLDEAGYAADPVGDGAAKVADGVIHKYHGRALLVATGSCAINCRYCFRRHSPYADENASVSSWRAALAFLRGEPSITEIILSGGDPLSLSTSKLAEFTDALSEIPQLRRLRIHSRLPIVLPERIDDELLNWLDRTPLQKTLVVHANHVNEIDNSVRTACAQLRTVNVTLLNQSVLLRGINDSVDALANLSEALIDVGVVPYYLHQLDRVRGAAHFEVDDEFARHLVEGLRIRLPGYLVPRLVREIAGERSKTPI